MSATEPLTQAGNPLIRAATAGGMEGLQAAWLEALEAPPPAAVFLAGLQSLPEGEEREQIVPLLTLLLEAYRERAAHDDALTVARALLPLRPRKLDLMAISKEAVAGLVAGEAWGPLFVELAGFSGADVEAALERFARLRRLLPGSPVYHGTGWGEGAVTSADFAERTITVRFRSDGRERVMPINSGLDVLRPLDADDLRGRLMVDAAGLQRDAESDPATLVRAVARLSKGRCTAKEIKQWLAGAVVPESAWNGWWKKAKAAAANDPWLIVENPARPTFILRRRALSAAEAVGDALARARDLPGVLDVVRDPLALEPEAEVKTRLLDGLALALQRGDGKPEQRLEAALLMTRHGRLAPAEAGTFLLPILDQGQSFGAVASRLSPAALRREALDVLVAARPGLWSDAIIGDLPSVPPTLLDVLADKLVADGRGPALANRLSIFLLTPSRQPETVVRLCRRWALGLLDGVPGAPGITEVFMGLLHLAETHAPKADRGDKDSKAIMKLLLEILEHRKADLFGRFGKAATRPEMERAMGVAARCPTLPREVRGPLETGCHLRFPDLVPRDETPFWEGNAILSGIDGLRRRQEEYRVLLEEKIPENSVSIGRAAAFGDLSENYEWTAAIEQQRQLTERAATMEAELKLARIIEEQELPEGVVAPGTRVTYELAGELKVITILGPWDHGEGVVSYRAPLASGMLGSRPGQEARLPLPSGEITVTVRAVERAVERRG